MVASALFELETLSANGVRLESDRREILGAIEEAKRSEEVYHRVRTYAESVHNENLMFMLHHQLAVLHLEAGAREPAREHFQRAFTLIDQLAERTGSAKEMFLGKPPVEAVFRDARRL